MLEAKLINLKTAIRKKKPKSEVKKKYQEYFIAYENFSERTVADKIRFREITQKYWDYMYFSGSGRE